MEKELKYDILEKIEQFEGVGIEYFEFYNLFDESPIEVYEALKELEDALCFTGIILDDEHEAFFYKDHMTLALTNHGEKIIYKDKIGKRKKIFRKIKENPAYDVNSLNFDERILVAKLCQEGYLNGLEVNAPEGVLVDFNHTLPIIVTLMDL